MSKIAYLTSSVNIKEKPPCPWKSNARNIKMAYPKVE